MRFSLRTLILVVAAFAAAAPGYAWVNAHHGPGIAETLFLLLGLNALAFAVFQILMAIVDHT